MKQSNSPNTRVAPKATSPFIASPIDTYSVARKRLHEVMTQVRALREKGDLDGAIERCLAATKEFPDDYLGILILGDLYFQKGEHQTAFICLGDFLGKIPPVPRLLANFAKRYFRFKRSLPREQLFRYAKALSAALDQGSLNRQVALNARSIIAPDISPQEKSVQIPETTESKRFAEVLKSDEHFNEFVQLQKKLEEKNFEELVALLDIHVLSRPRQSKTFRIDLYCVSIYEKHRQYDKAIKVVVELLALKLDPVAVRSLFRICRVTGNYDKVDELLASQPSIIRRNEFNVLYELVYYFEAKNDFEQLQQVLKTIERSFVQNLPVLRTLRNFYIRFGLIEDAKRLEPVVMRLYRERLRGTRPVQFLEELAESDVEVASKMQDLYSQLEHQKQLAAISDLTTGISHELGQPITNIRYTVQFYRKLFEKKLSKEGVAKVLDSILEETERMGGLVNRLSPLTSSRSVLDSFDIVDRIRKRVATEEARLRTNRISVTVSPSKPIYIHGDPVKFDQLISNLLLNSVDAILERGANKANRIEIRLQDKADEVSLSFADNGVGIPIKNRQRIFDPFFSTKPPGKGEGLGLFIVWNILKMQGGRISVDSTYKNGARFLITLPKTAPSQQELSI